jgi:NAD(P)-dependent dehydrogenase (short-subunit alcohol dehydrogenase family)
MTPRLFSLQDKVAIVTGAAGGIGQALTRGFAENGATVVAADLDGDAVRGVAGKLGGDGSSVSGHTLDVSDPAAIDRLVRDVLAVHGRIDVLVNNAGVKSDEAALDGNLDRWDRTLAINARSVLTLSRAVVPAMKGRGGRIVNIGSSVSSRAAIFNYQAGGADYCLSKAMVHSITQLLAYEAATDGVLVNAIAPGIVDTPMHGRPREETEARHLSRIPLERLGEPEDFVGPALFLASEGARYITGQILHVNGGMVMEP